MLKHSQDDIERLAAALKERLLRLSIFGATSPVFMTDSRQVVQGSVFVCFATQQAHQARYVQAACEQGACLCVVEEPANSSIPKHDTSAISALSAGEMLEANCWYLPHGTLLAVLQALARWYRSTWPKSLPVVAVTGSVGKTSTKTLIDYALQKHFKTGVYASCPHLNGQLGVALSILNAPSDAKCIVLEVGIDRPGGMQTLAHMVLPTHAVITNIFPVHLDRLENIETIAREKSGLFSVLQTDGVAFLNTHTQQFHTLRSAALHARLVQYSSKQPLKNGFGVLTVRELPEGIACTVHDDCQEAASLFVECTSLAFLDNVMAALSVATSLGMPLSDAARCLKQPPTAPGRMQWISLPDGARLLDDSWNASPASVRTLIDTVHRIPDEYKILVFADMKELSDQAVFWHHQVADWLHHKVDALLTYGDLAYETHKRYQGHSKHFISKSRLIDYLQKEMHHRPKRLIVLKGSRSMKLDAIKDALLHAQEV